MSTFSQCSDKLKARVKANKFKTNGDSSRISSILILSFPQELQLKSLRKSQLKKKQPQVSERNRTLMKWLQKRQFHSSHILKIFKVIPYIKKIRLTLFRIHRTSKAQTLPNTKVKFNKTNQTNINSKRQPKLIKKFKLQKKLKNNKPKLIRSQPTRLSQPKKLHMFSNQVLV